MFTRNMTRAPTPRRRRRDADFQCRLVRSRSTSSSMRQRVRCVFVAGGRGGVRTRSDADGAPRRALHEPGRETPVACSRDTLAICTEHAERALGGRIEPLKVRRVDPVGLAVVSAQDGGRSCSVVAVQTSTAAAGRLRARAQHLVRALAHFFTTISLSACCHRRSC